MIREFCKYVFQNILGMIGVSLYILADTFFISRAAGANGMTVLNLSLPVYGVIFALGAMIGVGSATRFTILRAGGKEEEAKRYFFNGLIWILLISIPFILAGIFCPKNVVALMGGDAVISEIGKSYFGIFMIFTPFFMINSLFGAFTRNDGAPGTAMLATLSGSLFNIVFDYLLMFPLGLGFAGAALATGCSPIVGILICSTHILGPKSGVKLAAGRLSVKRLFRSCQLGISAFVGEMSGSVTTLVFNFLILALAGNVGVAAYGVVANLSVVAAAIFNGAAQGSQPLISKYYGAGQKKEETSILKMGVVLSLLISAALFLAVWTFTTPIASVFNKEGDPVLAAYAFDGLRIYFAGFFFAGFNVVATGYFSATERAKESFIISILRSVVAIIIFAVVLSRKFGMNGVWSSFAAAEGLTALLTVIFLYKGRKRRAASI